MVELIWYLVLLLVTFPSLQLSHFPPAFPWYFQRCSQSMLLLSSPFLCHYTFLNLTYKMLYGVNCSLFFFLCPGKQIGKLSLGDGDEDLGCCWLSCAVACPWQKRNLPDLVCSAPSAGSCFQPGGNPHYFMVHVQEVLENLSVVFLTLYFPLKLLIFSCPRGRVKG